MERNFKVISRFYHEKSKQFVKKCESSIFQKWVSIKLWKCFKRSYYSSRLLGETKWRGKCFCLKIGRYSVFGVIRSDEVEYFIPKNIISSKNDVDNNVELVMTFLNHKCNDRCMVKTSTDEFRYRMTNYC